MSGPIRISLGGYQGPASVHTRGLVLLREALLRQAGDRIAVDLRPNMAEDGHATADLPGLVENGTLDGCYISSSYLADRIPALSLFDMPFAAPDRDEAFARLDGPLGDRFATEVEAHTGLVLLGIWDNGLRHVSTAGQPLRDPSHCDGLVLRTLPNAQHQRVFRSLGFEPLAVDAKDLPGAVARGEVDAQENPLTNTYNFGLHDKLPTITMTGHLMGIALVLLNRDLFLSWPEDVREAVRTAVAEASRAQRALARSDEAVSAQALSADGARMVELTADEHHAWRTAATPEVARCRDRLDDDLLSLFDADIHAARRASA